MLKKLSAALAAFIFFAVTVFAVTAHAGETSDKGDLEHCQDAPKKESQPPALALVGVGIPMAIADYFLGVTLHEGSHCLAVELAGGKCESFSILPERNENGTLTFGHTVWSGRLSKGEETFVLLAPKIIDITLMGSYAALLETNSLPKNKYAQLALAIVSAGATIDFAKHFVLRTPDNDVERAYALNGITGAARIPFEFLYGGTILAGGIETTRGFIKVFQKDSDIKGSRYLTKYGEPTVTPNSLGWRGEF